MVVVALLIPEVDLDALQLRPQCLRDAIDVHQQPASLHLRDCIHVHLVGFGFELFELKAQLDDLLVLKLDQLLLFVQLLFQVVEHFVFFLGGEEENLVVAEHLIVTRHVAALLGLQGLRSRRRTASVRHAMPARSVTQFLLVREITTSAFIISELRVIRRFCGAEIASAAASLVACLLVPVLVVIPLVLLVLLLLVKERRVARPKGPIVRF